MHDQRLLLRHITHFRDVGGLDLLLNEMVEVDIFKKAMLFYIVHTIL